MVKSLSVISTSTGFPPNIARMWDVSPTACSVVIMSSFSYCSLCIKKEQNFRFEHFHHSNFLLVHVLRVWMVATLKREGGGYEH